MAVSMVWNPRNRLGSEPRAPMAYSYLQWSTTSSLSSAQLTSSTSTSILSSMFVRHWDIERGCWPFADTPWSGWNWSWSPGTTSSWPNSRFIVTFLLSLHYWTKEDRHLPVRVTSRNTRAHLTRTLSSSRRKKKKVNIWFQQYLTCHYSKTKKWKSTYTRPCVCLAQLQVQAKHTYCWSADPPV